MASLDPIRKGLHNLKEETTQGIHHRGAENTEANKDSLFLFFVSLS